MILYWQKVVFSKGHNFSNFQPTEHWEDKKWHGSRQRLNSTMKTPIIKWENFVLILFCQFFVCLYLIIVLSKNIFVHTIMAWGQVILESLLSIELCNDCIVVIAHPYHGNVVFIVHFYIITTFMLPPGLQAISGRPELFKQRSKRCKNWANINDVRDYHMSRSCPSKIIDDEYKWSRI